MDKLEFKRIQKELKLNNHEMADSLGMDRRSVEYMRSGGRRVTSRTKILLELLLEKQLKEKQ